MNTGSRRILLATIFVVTGLAAVWAQSGIPPAEAAAMDRLAKSPRHGEWVVVDAGNGDRFDAWVVYPERSDKAPVVLVIHEIFGLSDWVRSVVDQLAADGFIAIAPDFLSGKAPEGKGSRSLTADQARALIPGLKLPEIVSRLDAAARYATSLPAATKEFGVVGYCWGGGISFAYAVRAAGSRRRGRLLRYLAGGREPCTGEGAGARPVWRRRREGQRDGARSRGGARAARETVRGGDVRGRGPWVPPGAGWQGGKSRGCRESMAADDRVPPGRRSRLGPHRSPTRSRYRSQRVSPRMTAATPARFPSR